MDMTDLYIQNFGCIPSPGQFVLFMAIPMSATSGQFFTPIIDVLEIEAVYIDGFFLNVVLPAGIRNIIFSVYLSKPVSKGQSYAGTKVRFMGCFSSKTFLELTDTPSSYVGQAGKGVKVKVDETGLEFGESGGGSNFLELCLDFDNPCQFIYSVPVAMKFTTIQYEGTAPVLLPVINTNLSVYQDFKVTATSIGLVIIRGEIL